MADTDNGETYEVGSEELGLDDVTAWIRRRWLPFVVVVLVCTALFAAWGWTKTATHSAKAVVRLDTTNVSYYPSLNEAEGFVASEAFQKGAFEDAGIDDPPPGTMLATARFI